MMAASERDGRESRESRESGERGGGERGASGGKKRVKERAPGAPPPYLTPTKGRAMSDGDDEEDWQD